MNKLMYALGAVSALALSTPALSQTYTAGTNQTYTFGDDLGLGGAAFLDLTLDTVASGVFTFSYDLTNTSNAVLNPAARVTSFGFNDGSVVAIDGDILSGDFQAIDISGTNYPNGHGTIAVCLFEDNGSCTGSGDGIAIGDTFSGTFSLTYADTTLTSLALSDFVVRYQSLANGGSSTGSPNNPPPPPPPPVPEPSTWAMILIGFGGVGYSMRRRRKRVIAQLA